MNRRRFFAAPLMLLPGSALPATDAMGAPWPRITVNLSGAFDLNREFVDSQLVPALRAAIECDVIVIPPQSRQADLLR